jgi:hypothetical protein
MTHEISAADLTFLRQFESGAVAPAHFHHREHIRLAYIYLVLAGPDEAYARLRASLHAFIERNGVDPAKYHDTLTRAWILAVHHFMNRPGDAAAGSSDDFLATHDRLLNKDLLHHHYSSGVLGSEEARAHFVEPDLQPIPRHA